MQTFNYAWLFAGLGLRVSSFEHRKSGHCGLRLGLEKKLCRVQRRASLVLLVCGESPDTW